MASKKDINEIAEILPNEEIDISIPSENRFEYITKKGIKVKLRVVDLMKIKKVRDSVKIPKRPTYDAKTYSGKVQTLFIDEVSAEQVPNGKVIWERYIEERQEALADQTDKVMRSLLFFGTEVGEMPEDNMWEEELALFEVQVQTHSDERINGKLRWVEYLLSECKQEDLIGLSNAIMKCSGVTEEEISEAEEAFRG